MRRGKLDEPKLCPSCKLKIFLPDITYRSYTRTPPLETTVKLCAKLRRYARQAGLEPCPHFPKTEVLNGWFGKPRYNRQKRKRRR